MGISTREELISIVSKKFRLIRSEYNFSQDKMAEILGISKKTLIQIEKERTEASWTLVLAVCGLFRESEILKMVIGEDPIELVETIVFKNMDTPKNLTGGGKVFWRDIEVDGKFKVQKNIISSHYRIIDGNNRRWYSSFDKEYILKKFYELLKGGEDSEEETE
ncbi:MULTISPECIES: helix-turn-helix transcriptional regulator [Clostridium]|mgnify:CR=1 FL=1|uniref:Helix-turn-helix domain protein n=2 Tax=Clostridium TaxID=1485 RepID=A0A151AL24_9CLOT|nr:MULTISPECIES: helix-turn-helix domain-containing protein [Clostridium]KYH28305.1 helix-turn-helix domain protein [Clostridium colicanis DSM 13634]MBE6043634.1 transcriptional regulator [Clostridium thermopalmarium]PRR74311.1 Helix-turn-helix domain protein [Clostridium thermopalmarium DSM 5974]PVZ22099.1 DNA-binding XRE family transcriptional regulator [Clostridium thermopalmarium DSM 5974]